MTSKRTLLFSFVTFAVVLLYSLTTIKSLLDSNDHEASQSSTTIFNTEEKIRFSKKPWFSVTEETYIPANWTGIPLSVGNNLYVDQNSRQLQNTKVQLKKKVRAKGNRVINESEWDKLADKFVKTIGWNGFFDVLEELYEQLIEAGQETHLATYHYIGNIVVKDAKKYRYAVEITTRDFLAFSPLHGAVWQSLIDEDLINYRDLFYTFIDEELCNFKYLENFGNTWISCIHGVGHGLSMLFGKENIPQALHVCEQKTGDSDWQYSCATGVFMDLLEEFDENSFAPCDTSRFPAACFRFKRKTFANLEEANITYPCDTQSSAYSRRGCIFGEAYSYVVNSRKSGKDAHSKFCEKYSDKMDYAVCVEGIYQSKKPSRFECDAFSFRQKAFDICSNRHNYAPNQFSFTHSNDTYTAWMSELLEENYDPHQRLLPATWPSS